MISEHDNANGYPWTDPKSPYPRLRDYVGSLVCGLRAALLNVTKQNGEIVTTQSIPTSYSTVQFRI